MRGSALLTATMALLSGLLLWAAWFTAAYALHGAQCAGALGLGRTGGQATQIALWAVAILAIFAQGRVVQRWSAKGQISPSLLRTARYLQNTAIAATLFVGLPVLVLAPC